MELEKQISDYETCCTARDLGFPQEGPQFYYCTTGGTCYKNELSPDSVFSSTKDCAAPILQEIIDQLPTYINQGAKLTIENDSVGYSFIDGDFVCWAEVIQNINLAQAALELWIILKTSRKI